MRFWWRELAGWALVGLGLYMFYLCFVLLINHYLLEAGPWALVGIVVFRGGIHLLKVAVAARICLHAQREILAQEAGVRGQGSARRGEREIGRRGDRRVMPPA
jgi:hypothetical protein